MSILAANTRGELATPAAEFVLGNTESLSKRLTDFSLALVAAVFTVPILVLASVAIRFESSGPVLFCQTRSTRSGRPFKIYKLRTMVNNAEKIGPVVTQESDPRVTKVGHFLRRTSLDELPQIFNVLRGEMSIVGPRPELSTITDSYDAELREVLLHKPGITGISQINGRAALETSAKVRMEIAYQRKATWWSDLKIILKTPAALVSNRGNVM